MSKLHNGDQMSFRKQVVPESEPRQKGMKCIYCGGQTPKEIERPFCVDCSPYVQAMLVSPEHIRELAKAQKWKQKLA